MKLLDGNELWVEIYRLEHRRKWKNRTNIAFRECLNLIQFFPKVDAEPVRHGHWVEIEDSRVRGYCSVCGWESHLYEDDVVGMSYCPNCGAKMEEEDEQL